MHGVSARACKDPLRAIGGSGVSKSRSVRSAERSRLCAEIDERIQVGLTRSRGHGPDSGWAPPASTSPRKRADRLPGGVAMGVNLDGVGEVPGIATDPSEHSASPHPSGPASAVAPPTAGLQGVRLVTPTTTRGSGASRRRRRGVQGDAPMLSRALDPKNLPLSAPAGDARPPLGAAGAHVRALWRVAATLGPSS